MRGSFNMTSEVGLEIAGMQRMADQWLFEYTACATKDTVQCQVTLY